MPTKKELRSIVRQRKGEHSAEELEALSRQATTRLLELAEVKAAHTVMLYCALPDEVQTLPLIRALKDEGKRILLPAVTGATEMELRVYETDNDLRTGSFGIMEPAGRAFTKTEEIDVMIIPGMAFDAAGNRLGRGKGYYDRFLAMAHRAYRIGVCFPFQMFDEIPAGEFDVKMDKVIY